MPGRVWHFPCYRHVDDLTGKELKILKKGYKLRGPDECHWRSITTVQLRNFGPLGSLIVTHPCMDCDKPGDKHLYLSELSALSLLLRLQLSLRSQSLEAMKGRLYHPSRDEVQLKKRVSVLVVNMTPNQVRVLEAILPDPDKPDVHILKLDRFDHDLGNHEQDHQDKHLLCKECRRILAWLNFTAFGETHDPVPESPAAHALHESNTGRYHASTTHATGPPAAVVMRPRQTSGESNKSSESDSSNGTATPGSSSSSSSVTVLTQVEDPEYVGEEVTAEEV